METKLNLNLAEGIIEVSGSEEFVKSIYEDIVEGKLLTIEIKHKTPKKKVNNQVEIGSEATPKKTTKKSKISTNRPKLMHELNLYPNDREQFKDFFNKYDLKTFFEKNLVIVHYLQEILKLDEINADMIYTCYKDVGEKSPEQLKQSLTDTKTQKGWLVHKNGNNIQLTPKGENAMLDLKTKEIEE